MNASSWPGAWGVLGLFCIPVGGGIPGGVLLARSRGIGWPAMMALYFVSDVLLAFTFEPLMKGAAALGRRSPAFGRVVAAFRASLERTIARYDRSGGARTLVMIAFGVDPMTGRAAAAAAGHGFVSGWAHAIAGDMLYFTLIMSCTLWLRAWLGDGTAVMWIVLAGMIGVPYLLERLRELRNRSFPPS